MGHFDKLYAHSPIWAQHLGVSAFGIYRHWLRFGTGYKQSLHGYLERENFGLYTWQVWQDMHLRNLLSLAATKVPYYRQTWSRTEKQAALAGQLSQLPLLDKSPIRADPQAFVQEGLHSPPDIIFHTSGSTGTPIRTMWTPAEVRDSIALREARSNRWAGISFSMPRATFSGRIVEPDPHSTGPFYRFNLVSQQVYLSAFHLRPDTARLYVDALHRHKVQWLVGYAVSYYLLAKLMIEQQLQPPPLRAIITTSEKVTPEMRHIMEQAFACRVYEEYSTVENVIFASECEYGRLHISPDASVVEILRSDGTPCDPGEVGEVVTTCLTRNSQPFIRYRVGDMAAWASTPCPCGRMLPVLEEVTGRIEDVVIGPDGRQMVRFHGIFVDLPHIREGQIIQEALTCIRAKIIPTDEFDTQDEQAVTQRIKQRLGHQVDVIVELVQNIPRTANGKFRAVISQLSPEEREQATRDSVHR